MNLIESPHLQYLYYSEYRQSEVKWRGKYCGNFKLSFWVVLGKVCLCGRIQVRRGVGKSTQSARHKRVVDTLTTMITPLFSWALGGWRTYNCKGALQDTVKNMCITPFYSIHWFCSAGRATTVVLRANHAMHYIHHLRFGNHLLIYETLNLSSSICHTQFLKSGSIWGMRTIWDHKSC